MKIYGYSLPGLDKRYERAYNQNTPWGYTKTSMFCGLFSQNAGMVCKHIMGRPPLAALRIRSGDMCGPKKDCFS